MTLEEINIEIARLQKRKLNLPLWAKILFWILGIGLIFLTPLTFTSYSYFSKANFTQTGQIGDTIGGITAPFINLLGAILVYLSFKEQFKANQIQLLLIQKQQLELEEEKVRTAQQMELQRLESIYMEIKNEIGDLRYPIGTSVYDGIEAVDVYVKYTIEGTHFPSFVNIHNSFVFIFDQMTYYFSTLNKSRLEKEDKIFLSRRMQLLYYGKLIRCNDLVKVKFNDININGLIERIKAAHTHFDPSLTEIAK